MHPMIPVLALCVLLWQHFMASPLTHSFWPNNSQRNGAGKKSQTGYKQEVQLSLILVLKNEY